MKKNLLIVIVFIISALLIILVSVKGMGSDPFYFQHHLDPVLEGPYDSSGTSSRYALTVAISQNHTFDFTHTLAVFASPDVVYFNQKYFSIFTPGISFLAAPFYELGSYFNSAQFFAFFVNIIFALLNMVLIIKISSLAKIKKVYGIISGLCFTFATNSLTYAGTLTQHEASTFLMLLSVVLTLRKQTLFNFVLLGILFGLGILIDIPNVFLLIPSILYAIFKGVSLNKKEGKLQIHLPLKPLALAAGLLPFVLLYGFYNYQLTGSYTKIGQFIGRSPISLAQEQKYTDNSLKAVETNQKLSLISTPYDPRIMVNGFYILLFSDERGIFYYSPLLILGLFGLLLLYKEKKTTALSLLLISPALLTILTYSMFGDPWGGWSFGARYMIPVEAVLSLGIGKALFQFRKNKLFLGIFLILLFYSVYVALIGPLTTSSVPSKGEALKLNIFIPYTWERGMDLILQNKSGSLFYNFFINRYLSLQTYFLILVILVIGLILSVLSIEYIRGERENK